MKRSFIGLIAGMYFFITGCGHVAQDLRHPGGLVGGVLDTRMFNASKSKELVLLRSVIMIAMVARAGTVYSRDEKDSAAYVNYIIGSANEINYAAGHIGSLQNGASTGLGCDLSTTSNGSISLASNSLSESSTKQKLGGIADQPNSDGCFTYDVNFESDLPMLEKKLFKLAMAALPQEQAKRFLDQVTKGDTIGAALAAFNFSAKALDGLHTGAAVHRTGLEIVARQHVNCTALTKGSTVFDAAKCMGLPTDTLFVGVHDSRDQYFAVVNRASFQALMRNLRDSCRMIPLGIDDPNSNLNKLRDSRIEQCNAIEFKPRSRWS